MGNALRVEPAVADADAELDARLERWGTIMRGRGGVPDILQSIEKGYRSPQRNHWLNDPPPPPPVNRDRDIVIDAWKVEEAWKAIALTLNKMALRFRYCSLMTPQLAVRIINTQLCMRVSVKHWEHLVRASRHMLAPKLAAVDADRRDWAAYLLDINSTLF